MITKAPPRRIFMFTDFGPFGPYLGQMRAAMGAESPDLAILDLVNDAPRFSPLPSAYLLAALAEAEPESGVFLAVVDPGVGTDRRPVVVYVDWYGNLVTGLRGGAVAQTEMLRAAGRDIPWARTFGAAPPGAAFWYVNSSGLVEVAVNGGRVAEELDLAVGDSLEVVAVSS